jgi:hypothetical protein
MKPLLKLALLFACVGGSIKASTPDCFTTFSLSAQGQVSQIYNNSVSPCVGWTFLYSVSPGNGTAMSFQVETASSTAGPFIPWPGTVAIGANPWFLAKSGYSNLIGTFNFLRFNMTYLQNGGNVNIQAFGWRDAGQVGSIVNFPTGGGGGGGSGTVTSFSASAWPSWLHPNVATATTTPLLTVSADPIPNNALTSPTITINSQSCTLGGACTVTSAGGITGPGSTTTGFLPTWSSTSGLSLANGLQPTGTGTKVVSSIGSTTTGNCSQWSSGNLIDSGAPCSGTGGGITALTGDVAAAGAGSVTATLATVNSVPGTCGDATHVCQITTNGKGLTTAQAAVAITSSGGSGVTITTHAGLPGTCPSAGLYLTTDDPIQQSIYTCQGASGAPAQYINVGPHATLAVTAGSLDTTAIVPTTNGSTAITATWPFNAGLTAGNFSAAGTPVPTCNSGSKGKMIVATDVTTGTFGATYASGGGLTLPLICNSSAAWVVF